MRLWHKTFHSFHTIFPLTLVLASPSVYKSQCPRVSCLLSPQGARLLIEVKFPGGWGRICATRQGQGLGRLRLNRWSWEVEVELVLLVEVKVPADQDWIGATCRVQGHGKSSLFRCYLSRSGFREVDVVLMPLVKVEIPRGWGEKLQFIKGEGDPQWFHISARLILAPSPPMHFLHKTFPGTIDKIYHCAKFHSSSCLVSWLL